MAEDWVYFDWFKDVEYKIKDDKFYGVKIKLTSDTFHPVSPFLLFIILLKENPAVLDFSDD